MFIKNVLKIFLVFFRKSSNACVLMHDKSKLYRARSGYIRAITITFTLIVILSLCGAVRFNLSAWRRSPPRPHSRTCSSPYSIRAVSLPHTSRSPQCCLNDSCNLLYMVFLDLFLRLLHLHRIVCQSVPATPSLYYHSTKHISSLVRSSVVDFSIFH